MRGLLRGLCAGLLLAGLWGYSPVAAAKNITHPARIFVAPDGSDTADGSAAHPFRTLKRAEQAVRALRCGGDVRVEIAYGVYRLRQPLIFTAEDGGCGEHQVAWIGASSGAPPVISGAMRVGGWRVFNRERDIYVARVPVGANTRQLWVNDRLAPRTREEIPRADVAFTRQGMTVSGGILDSLGSDTSGLEIDAIGFFTSRVSPVARVEGHTLVMQEPAWQNNLWGYDTIERPFGPQFAHLYLANSLALLRHPGEWYIDPQRGRLYLRPPAGAAIDSLDVELPRLAVLVAIGNNLAAPVRNLAFRRIRFSYTTWLGPSGPEGYASQQSGTFLTGRAIAYPADPIKECPVGCPAFETMRNEWNQTPASVEVAAAQGITFEDDIFAHLGQYALGIGNDADANLTGVGLGAGYIRVLRSVFTDDAGGAIQAGGVRRDAHHPSDPRMVNRLLVISNNRIQNVSEDYQDNSAILETYFDRVLILHNDISNVPYDAVDIGFGWGIEDPGGNPNYRVRMHGYDYKPNRVYRTPTTQRDVVVAWNRIHRAKQLFHDGGAIYNLSASPGAMITENYIFDNSGRIALYLDEGSRYVAVRRNVVDDPGGTWLNINTVHAAFPLRITIDNTASDNWHNGTRVGGMWTNYQNDLILDDHLVKDGQWPEEARRIMAQSGVEAPKDGNIPTGAKP